MTYQKTRSDISNEGIYLAHGMQVIGSGRSHKTRLFRNLTCGHEQESSASNVARGLFRCGECHDKKLHDEASNVGLKFLGKIGATSGLYALGCGHEQKIECGNVRNGVFRCRTCKENKWHQEASDAGLIFLNKVDGQSATYRLSCGHDKIISVGEVRNGEFLCQICQEQKWHKEADAAGLIFIGKVDGHRAKYSFHCGHEQIIFVNSVKKGLFRCHACHENKLRDEAKSAGLKFIEKIDGRSARYVMPCGHEQTIVVGNVRFKQFSCQSCQDTWATLPSNVYLHKISYGSSVFLKLGRARNVKQRSVQYGLAVGAELKILRVWPTKTGIEADKLETLAAKKFKRYNKSKAKLVLQESGWTECYNIDDQQAITELIEEQLRMVES